MASALVHPARVTRDARAQLPRGSMGRRVQHTDWCGCPPRKFPPSNPDIHRDEREFSALVVGSSPESTSSSRQARFIGACVARWRNGRGHTSLKSYQATGSLVGSSIPIKATPVASVILGSFEPGQYPSGHTHHTQRGGSRHGIPCSIHVVINVYVRGGPTLSYVTSIDVR